ncbi:vitamin B12 dependent-methionine synthase activation domain-containing protein [Desulfosporosinus burensis]
MDTVVLNNIQCKIDLVKLQEKLHIKENSSFLSELLEMAAEAQLIAKPKVIFKRSFVEAKGDNFVVIDGIKFTSRILRVNLDDSSMVFPYIVTCGTELEVWSKRFKDDYFQSYCVDTIKEMVLKNARQEFEAFLDREFSLGHASNMYPGSLQDWPITEQKPLFDLLDNVEELIGVQLTNSYLLLPIKTVSGIRFPKESTFESCQLCPRENCPSRKVSMQSLNI